MHSLTKFTDGIGKKNASLVKYRDFGTSSGFICRPYTYTLSIVDTYECFAQDEYFCVIIRKVSAIHNGTTRCETRFQSVFPL